MIKGYQAEIERIYEGIREKEDNAFRERRKEIQANLPIVLDLEAQIGKLCVEVAVSSFKEISNREVHINNLKNRITDLRVKKYEVLGQHGYSGDYIEKHYKCNKCKDTGFIGNNKCTCYKNKMVQLYYNSSELKEMLSDDNFKNFNFDLFPSKRLNDEPESPRKNMEKIYDKMWTYVEEFETSNENVLFYGNAGTGKTFLSHCLAKELLDRGYLVVYRTADDLIQDLRSVKLDNDASKENLLINCDLLIIDDLGTEQITNFSKTELFNLLNKKLLKGKKMLVSSNYTLEVLSKTYSERITSRLFGNFSLNKFYGEDIRVKKNFNKMR
ncbi:MAG: ATP-binding protein [Clostridiaceae bacterium]|nr:ATP-binding protein [Clostridiaceae bacterium]